MANLTEQQIRRGVHRSTAELESAITSYIETVNANLEPFVWTKSADDIRATIKRFCLRTLKTAEIQTQIGKTSETGHYRVPANALSSVIPSGFEPKIGIMAGFADTP